MEHGYKFEDVMAEYDKHLARLVNYSRVTNNTKEYYTQYRDHAIREFAAVDYDEARILEKYQNGDWMQYNLRGGVASIVGELGEMIATRYYVVCGHYVQRCESREEQVAGRDLLIRLPRWANSYSVSVKVRKQYGDNTIHLRDGDFPHTTTPPHRIAYVLLDQNKIFQCDYPDIMRYYRGAATKAGATSIPLSVVDFRTFRHCEYTDIAA